MIDTHKFIDFENNVKIVFEEISKIKIKLFLVKE